MKDAVVGDDVFKEDPTVNGTGQLWKLAARCKDKVILFFLVFAELERIVAEMFGKEAALFVPTGTMGNLAASKEISLLCRTYAL